MNICVFGLGHLGIVTAACLAGQGHQVVGLDPDPAIVERLVQGDPGMLEPGVAELLERRPSFTTEMNEALPGAEVLWLADDTPVDEHDRADIDWVLKRALGVVEAAVAGTLIVVSSQLPVGSVASLERARPDVDFACVPENLRLGRAVEAFLEPTRVVIGMRTVPDERALRLFEWVADRIVWMSIESAEVTKHALNAFLATSVVFANEIASICEVSGADARDVELGLRTDPRIGERAYLSAGPPFAGGTLARDVAYLRGLGAINGRPTILFDAVVASNEEHRQWVRRRLESAAPSTVAVWGLSYKPGTDSIRRSEAVELCSWLLARGAQVRAHDPAVGDLPGALGREIVRANDPVEAVVGAEALVVAVPWPVYLEVAPESVVQSMTRPLIIDPFGFTREVFAIRSDVVYTTVGAPQ